MSRSDSKLAIGLLYFIWANTFGNRTFFAGVLYVFGLAYCASSLMIYLAEEFDGKR